MVTSRAGWQFWNRADSVLAGAFHAIREGAARSGELAAARHHSGFHVRHFSDRWPWAPSGVASSLDG
jgi:hypothetical protein